MVDMAHFAGLVAGGVFRDEHNPIPFAHIVTSTTHKTVRGPRGGVIFCQKEFGEYVDKGCPMVIGGPLPQMMAAKAVAFTEANDPAFRAYASQVQLNARRLAQACVDEGLAVATGGTDNHLMLIDVTPFGLNGRQAESAVRACGITLNRNALPFDSNGPWYTSGLRVGTPAVTTLGMGDSEMVEIASILKLILAGTRPRLIVRGKQKEAARSVGIYRGLRAEELKATSVGESAGNIAELRWEEVYRRLKEAIRLRNYSPKTYTTYAHWIGQFQRFLRNQDPEAVGTEIQVVARVFSEVAALLPGFLWQIPTPARG